MVRHQGLRAIGAFALWHDRDLQEVERGGYDARDMWQANGIVNGVPPCSVHLVGGRENCLPRIQLKPNRTIDDLDWKRTQQQIRKSSRMAFRHCRCLTRPRDSGRNPTRHMQKFGIVEHEAQRELLITSTYC
jgi:hypothetical protein